MNRWHQLLNLNEFHVHSCDEPTSCFSQGWPHLCCFSSLWVRAALCWGKLHLQPSFIQITFYNARGFYDQKPHWYVCPLYSCVSSDIPGHLSWCSSCLFYLKPWESKQVSSGFNDFPESLYLHLSIAKCSMYPLSNSYFIFAFLLPSQWVPNNEPQMMHLCICSVSPACFLMWLPVCPDTKICMSGSVQAKHFISVVALTSFALIFWTLDCATPEAGGLDLGGKKKMRIMVKRREKTQVHQEEPK